MRNKSLKSSQILRAHMTYFRRPSHILGSALFFLFFSNDFCMSDLYNVLTTRGEHLCLYGPVVEAIDCKANGPALKPTQVIYFA